MTREQAQHLLKDRNLSEHDRERILQYLHYLDVEHVSPRSAKRPAKKSRHTGHKRDAGQT